MERKLNEQWVEEIDGKKHMVKEVKSDNEHVVCPRCMFSGGHGTCVYPEDDCPVRNGHYIKDLGILNDDGLLPCPFCGEYPESFNKGNEYTKKRGSVLKCNKCHYELTVCAIYQTIEWCKEKVLYNWNRRA